MYLLRGLVQFLILVLYLTQPIFSEIIRFNDGVITYEYDNSSKPLGKGLFGAVYQGKIMEGNRTESAAFKQLHEGGKDDELLKEAKIYEMMGHHYNLPRFYHYFPETSETRGVFVMELMGKALSKLWDEFRPFPSVSVMKIGLQVLDALEFMHGKGITHNDLHYGNIAVDYNNKSKIFVFDFGESEVNKTENYDMWMLSQSLNEMICASRDDKAYEHNKVLKEFEVVATKYNNTSDDGFRKETFAKLRSILRAELESHKNDTDYEKCDIGYIQDAVDAMSQLRKFIRQNDTTAIENLIQSDPGLNINAGFGGSSYFKPIHLAAELGNVRVVETLIKHGAEINAKHNNTHLEYSPLHYAASEGNADVVRFLCKRGADINVEDVHGRTPIHMAVLYAKADAVRVLCKCGVEINAGDDHGRTPIHWAALYELAEVARILIKHGADINARCLEGKTPLHYAAMSEIADVARILTEYGADINARCLEGKTPLHYAAMSGNTDAVRVLCECGAEINIKDNDGKTPLDIADSDEVINILKEVEQKWPNPMGLAA